MKRLFLTLLLLSLPYSSNTSNTQGTALYLANQNTATNENKEVLFYLDVFSYYYDITKRTLEEKNQEIPDFDTYIDFFYQQEETIDQYAIHYSTQSNNSSSFTTRQSQNNRIKKASAIEFISPDEDYIISSDLDDSVSVPISKFKRKPIANAFDYSKIYNGDIIYEAETGGFKHCAFVYDNNRQSGYGNFVETIEAVASGVNF